MGALPPLVMAILQWMSLAAQLAPVASKIYEQGRKVIAMMTSGGLITVEQQKAIFDWAEQHEADVLAGKTPVEFTVEADPGT